MQSRKTETTIRAYDRHAAEFDDKFRDYAPYREKIVEFQRRFLPPGAAILDVGCGTGINAQILLAKNSRYDITGIDLSAEMIALARRKVPDASFRVVDMRALQPLETYDAIIAAFCIVHLSDKETDTLLQAFAAGLKTGGFLYLSFMEGKTAGFETTSFSKDSLYFNYHKREKIGTALLENSMQPVAVYAEDYPEEDGSVTTDVFMFVRKIT